MDFSSSTMDSDEKESDGTELLNLLVSLTGLPEDSMIQEVEQLLSKIGKNAQDMTMENLREALILHLDSLHAEFGAPTE